MNRSEKKIVVVIGANWKAAVSVDPEIHDEIYTEAATRAMEVIFGPEPPKKPTDVIVSIPDPTQDPNLGVIIQTYMMENEHNEAKHYYVSSLRVARNAGIQWIVDQLSERDRQYEE